MTPTPIETVESLLGRYKLFLIDQFGVLHDGVTPYPQVGVALQAIADAGAKAVIISNSGKRTAVNEQRLTDMGIQRHSYHSLVTSGEVAFEELQRQINIGKLSRGSKCFLFANDGDRSATYGLELDITSHIDSAEIILLSGIRGDTADLDYYADLFKQPLARNIPMICTNPDKRALSAGGHVMGAGRIAEYYESAGGQVQWIGKPYPQIYRWILNHEGFTDNTDQVVCIGDSIEHDIAGGQTQHLATVLVTTGIHSDASDSERADLYHHYNAQPDYLLPAFS